MTTALVFKIGLLATISFVVAILLTPLLTHFLFKYKLGKQIRDAKSAPVFNKFHAKKEGTPTMGGILIWGTVLLLSLLFFIFNYFFPDSFVGKLNFLSRAETLFPLGIMVLSAIIGIVDDLLGIKKIGPKGGGLSMSNRLGLYTFVAAIAAWWFYVKLDWDLFHLPFMGDVHLGLWFIPVFLIVVVGTAFSVNETDGLDGLAGGVLLSAFASMGAMAFAQGKFDVATFCGVIVGALLAFLWFNINPARFFMGDTGAMSLGITLGVLAIFTDTAILLLFILFIPVLETVSVIMQLTSKKIRKKKVFHSAPIHHHFQAIGWSEPKIVMRFWLISAVGAVFGIIIFLLDKGWY